jgi:hypothetical protein
LARLLEPTFPGRDELREQVTHIEVMTIDEDGGLSLRCSGGPRAPVKCSVPTEGEYADSDGVPVHVLLHVVDGFVSELEVFKEECVPLVRREPVPSELVLFTPYGSEGIDPASS